MTSIQEEIPADIRDKAERVAGKLDDIHFNSRSASWLDDAVAIVAAALLAERNRAYEECAGIAQRSAFFEAPTSAEKEVAARVVAAIRALLK